MKRACLGLVLLLVLTCCASRFGDKVEVSSKVVEAAVAGTAGNTHLSSVAQSDSSAMIETLFFDFTNRDRATVGAPPLVRDETLDAYARNHALAMAAGGKLFHSDIASLLTDWSTIGENVGYGPNAAKIQEAYEGSPSHYENLTNVMFTATGVGVYVDANDRVYTVSEFTAR